MDTPRPSRRIVAAFLVLSIGLVGCSAGATAVPSTSPSPAGAGGVAPSEPGDDPDGVVTSPPLDPGASVPDPGATIVLPKPGVIDPKPVSVTGLTGNVDGGHVLVRVEWTSGVEPCYTLSSVTVARDGDAFTLTVLEGTTDPNAMCIEIAQFKATLVDLGELPAGTYTVVAQPSDVAPITITVP